MKKFWMIAASAVMMVCLLCACGGQKKDETVNKNVDLNEMFTELDKTYQWGDSLMDLEGEMLDAFYPGLSDLKPKQIVAKSPWIAQQVEEFVFVEMENEADADKAEEIMNGRITYQVGDDTTPGGAWYPESIEQWKTAEVVRNGNYVALVASGTVQKEVVDVFNKSFQ